MPFLRLTIENRDNQVQRRLVNVDDISTVKPADARHEPARVCVSLISQPDFPIWARESLEEIDRAMMNTGEDMAPHHWPEDS